MTNPHHPQPLGFFARLWCGLKGHRGVTYRPCTLGIRWTCKACGQQWTERDYDDR